MSRPQPTQTTTGTLWLDEAAMNEAFRLIFEHYGAVAPPDARFNYTTPSGCGPYGWLAIGLRWTSPGPTEPLP